MVEGETIYSSCFSIISKRKGGYPMKKKRNTFIIAILFCLLCSQLVSAIASDVIFYSNDYFTNDSSHANNIAYYFATNGHSVNVASRPLIPYAMNTNLQYRSTLYISTHGTAQGSTLKLDSNTYFNETNLTTQIGCDFIFYSACYSAQNNTATGNNLCSKSISNGASTVLGYSDSVLVSKSRFFETKFYERALSYNDIVYTSYITAKALFAAQYGTTDTVYTSVSMFGNGGLYL